MSLTLTVRASQMRMVESAVPVPRMSPSGWNSAAVYPDVTFSSDTCAQRHNKQVKPPPKTCIFTGDPDSRCDACKSPCRPARICYIESHLQCFIQ